MSWCEAYSLLWFCKNLVGKLSPPQPTLESTVNLEILILKKIVKPHKKYKKCYSEECDGEVACLCKCVGASALYFTFILCIFSKILRLFCVFLSVVS